MDVRVVKRVIALVLLALVVVAAGAQDLNITVQVCDAFGVCTQASQTATQTDLLFPVMGSQASSVYPWAQYPPGRTYNNWPEGPGIPERAQCGSTVTPLNTGASDLTNILNAINNCPEGGMVKLAAGVFVLGLNEVINFGYNTGNVQPNAKVNNITIRGAGPGPGHVLPNAQTSIPSAPACVGAGTCTIIFRSGWATMGDSGPVFEYNGSSNGNQYLTGVDLASDAAQGSRTIQLASAPTADMTVGTLARLDYKAGDWSQPYMFTYNSNPDWYLPHGFNGYTCSPYPTCTPNCNSDSTCNAACSGCWGNYSRDYRLVQQIVKITGVSGNTITIESPLSITFPTAYLAQFVGTSATVARGVGFEEMYLYGGGNGNGSLHIELCDGCWIRHVENHYSNGAGFSLVGCYHCEIRDSYSHEDWSTQGSSGLPWGQPTNGGGAYLMAIDAGTANSLIENNILWLGDKPVVMRATGGGNVFAYNYSDDTTDVQEVDASEAGPNASHYAGSKFELFEGNMSHRWTGDSTWGNALYITVFRNFITGVRASGISPIQGYSPDTPAGANNTAKLGTYASGGAFPAAFCDCNKRSMFQMQYHSWYHNIVGNVLGYSGMPLLFGMNWPQLPSYMANQTAWSYEYNTGTVNGQQPAVYVLGNQTDDRGAPFFPGDANMYQKTNRQGNYDYFTNSQIWYAAVGGNGTTSTHASQAMPNSLYLNSKPAFFGNNQWPWVNPYTGAIYTLPAQARFAAGTPNACLNVVSGVCHD